MDQSPDREKDWLLNTLRERYSYGLPEPITRAQAERIQQYEQQKNIDAGMDHLLSEWDEIELDRLFFRSVLTPAQYEAMEQGFERTRVAIEEQLNLTEESQARSIFHSEELLKFLEQQWYPAFFKEVLHTPEAAQRSEPEKAPYLQAEYRKYLLRQRKKLLVDYFRYYRGCAPQTLRANLLWLEVERYLPNLTWFRNNIDAGAAAVVNYLLEKPGIMVTKTQDYLMQREQALRDFTMELNKEVEARWPITGGVSKFGAEAPTNPERWLLQLLRTRDAYADVSFIL